MDSRRGQRVLILLAALAAGCRRGGLATADGSAADAGGGDVPSDHPLDLLAEAPESRPDGPGDAPPDLSVVPGVSCGLSPCRADQACVEVQVSVFNCLSCGEIGGYCCTDGRCAGDCCVIAREAPAGKCFAVESGACSGTCGFAGKPCCGELCRDPRTVCSPSPDLAGQPRTCVPCGKLDQPCCSLAFKVLLCRDGLTCRRATPSDRGTCAL